jgi:hypothetical protein
VSAWDDLPPDASARWGWDDANTSADAPAKPPRLTAIHALDAMREPAPAEVVEGIAWAGCVTVLVAESAAGKTFVALDLAAAISAGFSWHGRQVLQGSVVHIGFEGDAIGLRLRALHEHRSAQLEHVYRLKGDIPISPLTTREGELPSRGELDILASLKALTEHLAEHEAPPIVLIVVDTVRASMNGSEDSSESVSAYLRAIRRMLSVLPSSAALLVHHAGWQDGDVAKKRERGSSAFRGNVDATIYLEAGAYNVDTQSAPLTLTTHKVRDGEKPPPLHFIRQRVTFPELNAHGRPVTSCVIDPDPKTAADHAADQRRRAEDAVRALDLRILRVLADHPKSATSQESIRAMLGVKKDLVLSAIPRLLSNGWIEPPEKQRAPYTLTPVGRAALAVG